MGLAPFPRARFILEGHLSGLGCQVWRGGCHFRETSALTEAIHQVWWSGSQFGEAFARAGRLGEVGPYGKPTSGQVVLAR